MPNFGQALGNPTVTMIWLSRIGGTSRSSFPLGGPRHIPSFHLYKFWIGSNFLETQSVARSNIGTGPERENRPFVRALDGT
ncbi:hypothetical protein Hypma_007822 [Hypsizygus marmoreus]|uniref:Uncharacterized protein n=1 Tax=Hypsizygus marmoreus TaxID=39966 RepID=A0A369JW59_HYPMA|nr:hypothetical protein Hypma_007822 [Hypsizygus marmoreus]